MHGLTRRTFLAALPPLLAPIGASAADNGNYPTCPVTVLVPYAAGGGLDVVARLLAQKLAERTGKSFIVENRLGAGGVIAANSVAKAAPDGYTILAGTARSLPFRSRCTRLCPTIQRSTLCRSRWWRACRLC